MKLKLTHIFSLFVLLISVPSLNAQNKEGVISGFVSNENSGEALIGANILLYKDSINVKEPPYSAAAANRYGFYALPNLQYGKYIIIVRHIGYKTLIKEINVTPSKISIHLNIKMIPEDIKLQEVVVTGEKQKESEISTIDVSPDLLSKLPSLSGEVDLFKLLQLLPGIQTASEISNGLYVRGGSPDQTLTLVDGVIVYNPSHMGNIASTFNSYAISDVKLIKGAFPAEYGGRLSSVLDIKLRSGTKERNKAHLGLGLINAFGTLEGPLGENSTYMISGRTMYYDKIVNKFNKTSTIPRYNFYDLNTKITYNLSPVSTLTLSGLLSHDKIYSKPGEDFDYDIEWNNSFISIDWLHINNKTVFLKTSVNYIDFESKSIIGLNPSQVTTSTYFASSKLRDFEFQENAEIKWNEDNTFKSGIDAVYHSYNLLYSNAYDSSLENNPLAGKDLNSVDASLYLQNESNFTSQLNSNYGIRAYYSSSSKYFFVEPRISLSFAITPNNYIKSAFSITHQYLHLINKNDISLPTDLWYPSTKNILPSRSNEYVFGIDNYFADKEYLLSLETYYRNMKNLYEFKNSANLNPFDDSIENQFTLGEGEAYGFELFFNKRKGNFNGWIGYTLSWSKRKFDALNAGKIFYPKYDRRNDVSVVLSYKFSDAFNIGITWQYATGQRYSLPTGQYLFQDINIQNTETVYLNQSSLNEFTFPAYHRLDLNASYSFPWLNDNFEVYLNILNVYNHQNPFAQYVTSVNNPDGTKKLVVKRIILFPIIPTFGIKIDI